MLRIALIVLSFWEIAARTDQVERTFESYVMNYCVSKKWSCVIDMTIGDDKCTIPANGNQKKSVTQTPRCEDYQWTKSGEIHLFEPKNADNSKLNTTIVSAKESKLKYSPGSFLVQLTEGTDIVESRVYRQTFIQDSNSKTRFKTSDGTLKSALISAASQHRGSVWIIALRKEGYWLHANDHRVFY